MNKRLSQTVLFSTLLHFLTLTVHARILNYETTRLKSTAGAGVASLLVDESTTLNPASIAFFNVSALYFQKANGTYSSTDDPSPTATTSDLFSVIASDTKGALKGSVSYTKQNVGANFRKRIAASMASPVNKTSSTGFSYIKTEEMIGGKIEKYDQFIAGVTHIANRNFTVGVVVHDPLQERPNDTKAIIGLQYVVADIITFIVDGGADYNRELSETSIYNVASQIRVLDNFFIRFGAYEDKSLKERGTGVGVGWVQPKLVLEFAMKNISLREDQELDQLTEKLKETSFSLSYRF